MSARKHFFCPCCGMQNLLVPSKKHGSEAVLLEIGWDDYREKAKQEESALIRKCMNCKKKFVIAIV